MSVLFKQEYTALCVCDAVLIGAYDRIHLYPRQKHAMADEGLYFYILVVGYLDQHVAQTST